MAMKNLTRLFWLPITFLFLSFTLPAVYATETQNLTEIKSAAEQFLTKQTATLFQHQKVRIMMGNLDPHLKLPKCTHPLTIQPDMDLSKSNNTIQVSCHGEISWGVRIGYKLQRFAQVLTPSKTISKGEKITENDLQLTENDITSLNSYFTDKSSVVGQVAKTIILPGQIIQTTQIIPAKYVKRGEMVTLIAEIPGLKITSKGTALNDGTLGESIQVKALGSKRIVDATVVSEHTVKVSTQ